MNNSLAINDKTQKIYGELVTKFLKDPKFQGVDEHEKEKFLQLCIVNKLNPFKNEVYAVPRNAKQPDGSYKKLLTFTTDYHVFLNRAEESGMLSGRNIFLKKDQGKIVSGKITIYRKDRTHPFEYEADFDDLKSSESYSLWQTKPELMMRKQLIRIGFSNAFPEKCASLDGESRMGDEQVIVDGEISTTTSEQAPDKLLANNDLVKTDETNTFPDPESSKITKDMIKIISALKKYTGDDDLEVDDLTYVEGEALIKDMKGIVAKKYLNDNELQNLTDKQLTAIFAGDDPDIKLMREEALKHYKSLKS